MINRIMLLHSCHVLVIENCEYVALLVKGDITDVIKVRILK